MYYISKCLYSSISGTTSPDIEHTSLPNGMLCVTLTDSGREKVLLHIKDAESRGAAPAIEIFVGAYAILEGVVIDGGAKAENKGE